jgi:asparagine synthase (glutamine-hydrolysing)
MCGILFSINSKHRVNRLQDALKLMDHRGPDATGVSSFDNNIFMGFKRLSIIDLSDEANQPFTIGHFHLIFNGELYNYKELIIEHNLDIRTTSDTEVVLKMYQKYKENALDYFNGMFALVIYDEKKKDIFVARDRLGIKPLYYSENAGELYYCSEIEPIKALVETSFDNFAVRQYLKLRMTVKGHTIYDNIKMFPPGHYSINGKITRYWDYSPELRSAPKNEELEWLISNSVDIRKRSDVPVGSYLSGGLDSTILSYLLKPTHTWTVGFEMMNEFNWGKLANDGLGSIHHKTIVDSEQFVETAKLMIQKRKEPLSVPNEVLIYLMTKNVKRNNTVVLSGEGADELFWGYDRIFRWANEAAAFNIDEFDKMYSYGSQKDDEVIDFAISDLPGTTVLEKVAYYFQIHHLQGLLRRLDNSTMLCSVEARVPFVDHRLVELLAGSPIEWRMGSSIKQPLKNMFRKLIPAEIIDRKKIGFPVPLESIFPEQANRNTPMDRWLELNMKQLNIPI